MRFSLLVAAGAAAVAFAVGCSSSDSGSSGSSGPGTRATSGENGAPPPEAVAGGTETNPYGVAYPTDDLGYASRQGARPGNRMPNYKFLGFRQSDTSKPLQTISLADFYDPEGRSFKVIHFIASSVWCGPCQAETQMAAQVADRLREQKVVIIQALIDGPARGVAATDADLKQWIARFGIGFTTFLDPDVKNLGQFFREGAVPWNGTLDARTMEILTVTDKPPSDVEEHAKRWLTWVNNNPPRP